MSCHALCRFFVFLQGHREAKSLRSLHPVGAHSFTASCNRHPFRSPVSADYVSNRACSSGSDQSRECQHIAAPEASSSDTSRLVTGYASVTRKEGG